MSTLIEIEWGLAGQVQWSDYDTTSAVSFFNLRAFDLARGQFVGLYDYNAWQFVPSVGVNWQF